MNLSSTPTGDFSTNKTPFFERINSDSEDSVDRLDYIDDERNHNNQKKVNHNNNNNHNAEMEVIDIPVTVLETDPLSSKARSETIMPNFPFEYPASTNTNPWIGEDSSSDESLFLIAPKKQKQESEGPPHPSSKYLVPKEAFLPPPPERIAEDEPSSDHSEDFVPNVPKAFLGSYHPFSRPEPIVYKRLQFRCTTKNLFKNVLNVIMKDNERSRSERKKQQPKSKSNRISSLSPPPAFGGGLSEDDEALPIQTTIPSSDSVKEPDVAKNKKGGETTVVDLSKSDKPKPLQKTKKAEHSKEKKAEPNKEKKSESSKEKKFEPSKEKKSESSKEKKNESGKVKKNESSGKEKKSEIKEKKTPIKEENPPLLSSTRRSSRNSGSLMAKRSCPDCPLRHECSGRRADWGSYKIEHYQIRCDDCELYISQNGPLIPPKQIRWETVTGTLTEIYHSFPNNFREKAANSGRGLKSVHQSLEGFGNTTYGELADKSVQELIDILNISSTDTFLDLGSGVGNIVILVGLQVGCNSIGVEIDEPRFQVSTQAVEKFKQRIEEGHLTFPQPSATVFKDSFFSREKKKLPEMLLKHLAGIQFYFNDLNQRSTYELFKDSNKILCNNVCFDEYLNQIIFKQLIKWIQPGSQLVTMKQICPRHSSRCEQQPNAICNKFTLEQTLELDVDWKSYPCEAYLYTYTPEKKIASSEE